jgi:hypothetical protein
MDGWILVPMLRIQIGITPPNLKYNARRSREATKRLEPRIVILFMKLVNILYLHSVILLN